jgi:diguanylate cyclase (GGDEF)-like protein
MHLDIPTLMVMQSFAIACAGAVLLFAWLQNRANAVLGLWGAANLCAAAGIVSLMLGLTLPQPALLGLGGCLLPSQVALIWKAARTFDGKPAPLSIALAGPIFAGLAGVIPGVRDFAGSVGLIVGVVYAVAAAIALWLGRAEALAPRWPLIVLTILHACALVIGTYSTLTGSTDQSAVPSLTSLFGLIYFESIVYALGAAVFVLGLVKERNEAASHRAARLDPLCGIANRSGFIESAERVLVRCRHDADPVSVMMFDLDRFKAINDTHGHGAGDMVLRKFSEIAAAALRPKDVFGRLGGEEFAVVLPRSSIEVAAVRADKIRAVFATSCRVVGARQVDATVSCGIATSADGSETLDALLASADAALYRAKSEGRNRIKRADQTAEAAPSFTPSTVIRVA